MSASRKGKSIQGSIERVQREADQGVITHDVDDPGTTTVAPISNLPRKFQSGDPTWDNQVELKRQLIAEARGPDTRYGTIMMGDRDIRALLKKKQAQEAAKFDGWFGKEFNTADLPTRLLGEQLNPEYYQEREEALVQKADLALRIELMKLYGPRSEEDLRIIFGLQTGYLKLDKDWNKIGYNTDDEVDGPENRARYKQQLGRVSRFFKNQSTVRSNTIGTGRGAQHLSTADTPFLQSNSGLPRDGLTRQFEGSGPAARPSDLDDFFNFIRDRP